VCFFLAIYSYICDITTDENRSKRLSIMDAFYPIGVYIGMSLSSSIRQHLGLMVNFGISMALALLAMSYTLLFVKDSRVLREKRMVPQDKVCMEIQSEDCEYSSTKKVSLKGVLNPDNILKGAKATFKKRPHRGRGLIFILISIFLLDMLAMVGRGTLLFLFFRRQFAWSHVEYSRYMTSFGILGVASQVFLIPFLSTTLKWEDTSILGITTLTQVANQIVIAMSGAEWLVYVGAFVACLSNATTVICRSQGRDSSNDPSYKLSPFILITKYLGNLKLLKAQSNPVLLVQSALCCNFFV
jgi:fucose permease